MVFKPAEKDRLVNAITEDQMFKLSLARCSGSISEAARRHSLNPLMASILGDLFLGAVLATSKMKSNDTISFKIRSGGCLKLAVAEANATGEVRGYVADPNAACEAEDRPGMISKAIAEGTLEVSRWLGPHRTMQTSLVPMQNKHVARDLTWYFHQSEQVPSALILETELDEETLKVSNSVGLMVQALPGTPETDLQAMEAEVLKIEKLSDVVTNDADLRHVIFRLFPSREMKITSSRLVDFYCRCSKKGFSSGLMSLDKEGLESLVDEPEQEIICQYCSERYIFTREEIETMIEQSEKT